MLARLRRTIRDQWLGTSIALIALFVALGGPSYAAGLIPGSSLEARSVPGGKIEKNTLTGKEVKEAKLGRVPKAKRADVAGDAEKLGGLPPSAFLNTGQAAAEAPKPPCPPGTGYQSGFCFELSARPAATWLEAARACAAAGRRLATSSELVAVAQRTDVDMSAAEWTTVDYTDGNGSVSYGSATTVFEILPGTPGPTPGVRTQPHIDDVATAYRCVIDAGNA